VAVNGSIRRDGSLVCDYSGCSGRDFKQAQEQTGQLLQKQPNNPQVHVAVSNLLIGQKDFPAAIQEMQKAIALGPNNWEP
jgi:predicted Zn-dependent protease